jgi:glycosyltransferase involved in cell wall biosynthesis
VYVSPTFVGSLDPSLRVAAGRPAMKKIRIIHIINSFEFGGAEAMLCSLLLRTDTHRFEPSVVSLIDHLNLAGPILEAGIPLFTVGMQPKLPNPLCFARLVHHLRASRPAIVQTWMDHSNLIGGLAARLVPRAKVIWGVHHSNHVPGLTKRTTLLTVSAGAALSRCVPAKVILCSEHSKKLYAARGFVASKLHVIPNGFDTTLFRPDPEARQSIRFELGIPSETPLIGLVARYDPLKDHATFLQAAGVLAASQPNVHFLLCGTNVTTQNTALMAQINALHLTGRVHLLGPRRDVPRIYAALDLNTSSSISEAFPLAVGEAMACGIPTVATDVGDSSLIIGDTGRIVPASNPAALAAGWNELLTLAPDARRQLGEKARQRVCELFDLTAITRRYEAVYTELATPRRCLNRPYISSTLSPAMS